MVGWALLLFGRMQRLFFFRKKISFFLLFCSFLFTARSRPKLFGGRASSRALWMCVLSSLASLFLWYIEPFTFKLFTFFFFSSSTWRPEQLSQKIILEKRRNMREILKKKLFSCRQISVRPWRLLRAPIKRALEPSRARWKKHFMEKISLYLIAAHNKLAQKLEWNLKKETEDWNRKEVGERKREISSIINFISIKKIKKRAR